MITTRVDRYFEGGWIIEETTDRTTGAVLGRSGQKQIDPETQHRCQEAIRRVKTEKQAASFSTRVKGFFQFFRDFGTTSN